MSTDRPDPERTSAREPDRGSDHTSAADPGPAVDLDRFQLANRANWDDRTVVHVGSDSYGLQRYVDDPDHISSVVRFDAPLLGDLTGRSLVHLQCHIGTDTVSLARLGAVEVAGLDFSPAAIDAARGLADRCGAAVAFHVGNVYDAPAVIGRTFDVVYTGVGAINWIADLDRWAAAVAGLLRPGGRFYIRDLHPMAWVFEEVDGVIGPHYTYWTDRDDPVTLDDAGTYTDGDTGAIRNIRTHEWNHPIAEIVNALVDHGLAIDRLAEHQGADWEIMPSAVREGDQWFLPGAVRTQVPLMFSLWATRRPQNSDVVSPDPTSRGR